MDLSGLNEALRSITDEVLDNRDLRIAIICAGLASGATYLTFHANTLGKVANVVETVTED